MPYGVTEELLEAYAGIVFDLSLNKQVRRGDPIRKLDVESWKAAREATGLSDAEIAARIGLAEPQVTHIRNIVERRLFRTNQYRKLYRLGGGKRYQPDTYVDPEAALAVTPAAEITRRALAFDTDCVTGYIRHGHWTGETLLDLLTNWSRERPEAPALVSADGEWSWQDLTEAVSNTAAGLAARDIRRGNIVRLTLGGDAPSLISLLGVLANGNVALPLPADMPQSQTRALTRVAQAEAIIGKDGKIEPPAPSNRNSPDEDPQPGYIRDILNREINPENSSLSHAGALAAYGVAAGDPALLLPASADMANLVPHTHHTLLANARAMSELMASSLSGTLAADGLDDPLSLALTLPLWLCRSDPLVIDRGADYPDSGVRLAFAGPGKVGTQKTQRLTMSHGNAAKLTVLATTETLGCLYRTPDDPSHWTAIAPAEIRSGTAENAYLEYRGPGMAPGFIQKSENAETVFTGKGWVRTRLAGSIETGGRVRLLSGDRTGD